MRSRWIYPTIGAVLCAAVVLVLSWSRGPALIPIGQPPELGMTIAGELTLEPAKPIAGGTVTARARLSADRSVVLRGLTVKVLDDAGEFHDFPTLTNTALGPEPSEIVLRRALARGTYQYYLAYQLDEGWVSLAPWERVTVR